MTLRHGTLTRRRKERLPSRRYLVCPIGFIPLLAMKVLYLSPECKPFAKVGGLGDVAGELPLALRDLGVDIEIALPLYGSIDKKHVGGEVHRYKVSYLEREEEVRVYSGFLRDVPVLFVQNQRFFEGDQYSSPFVFSEPTPFLDDIIRFSFFSEAALPLIREREPDIVHVNDWPLGYLLGRMVMIGMPQKRVLTVHNVGYQGNLYIPLMKNLHVRMLYEDPRIGPFFEDPRPQWRSVNALRLALELADAANTVSPTYCSELAMPENHETFFEGGKGLEGVAARLVEQGRLTGILNGFVYTEEIATEDGFRATLEAKEKAKRLLGSRFARPNNFLLGFVGRAVEQKFRLLTEPSDGIPVLEHLLEVPDLNLAILATGLPRYESFISGITTARTTGRMSYEEWLAAPRRSNYSCTVAFDREMAKRISLGSDIFLMPSVFEPCGITQLESMSQATPPLVRRTGGLADTVRPHTESAGAGFVFDGASRDDLLQGLIRSVVDARSFWVDSPEAFNKLQWEAYRTRFTWEVAAKQYVERLYEPVLAGTLKAPL